MQGEKASSLPRVEREYAVRLESSSREDTPRFLFVCFAVFAIIVGLLPYIAFSGRYSVNIVGSESAEGYLPTQALYAMVYLCLAFAIVASTERRFRIHLIDALIWLLSLLALVSVVWSTVPTLTLRRAVPLMCTTALAALIASMYTFPDQIQIFGWSLGTASLLAILFVILVPSIAIHEGGAWRAFFPTKNELGRHGLFACITLIFLQTRSYRLNLLRLAMLAASLILTFQSRSSTALVILAPMLVLALMSRIRFLSKTTYTGLLAGLVIASSIAAVIVAQNPSIIADVAGKDPTFTGRTVLWQASIDSMSGHVLLGYGYYGFWTSDSSPAYLIAQRYEIIGGTHAHNGYIDLTLDLGVVGLVLLVASLVVSICAAFRLATQHQSKISPYAFVMLSTIVTYNIAETTFIRHSNIYWLILLTTMLRLPRITPLDTSDPDPQKCSTNIHWKG